MLKNNTVEKQRDYSTLLTLFNYLHEDYEDFQFQPDKS